MVSIGELMKLLLLLPLILCTNNGFLKLDDTQNNERIRDCGKFKDFNESSLMFGDKYLTFWISSHHFLADVTVLTNHYDTVGCGTSDKTVTNYLDPNIKGAAKLVGECNSNPVGIVLGDSHGNYQQWQKTWFCIHNESIPENKIVKIVSGNTVLSGNVIKCNKQNESVFCVKSQKGLTGLVFYESNGVFSIVGQTINHKEINGKIIYEVYYLRGHSTIFCEAAGICDPSLKNNEVSTSSGATITESVFPTTAEKKAETTTTETVIAQPTVPQIPSIASSAAVTTETPTTETLTTETPSTEIPSTSSVTEVTTRIDQLSTERETSSSEKYSTASIAQSVKPSITQKPHAEPLIGENLTTIDCEKNNLCFDEDIFASANHFNILFIFCLSLFLIIV